MRLRYHDSALADIEGIIDYVEPFNPKAATRLAEGILNTCAMFESHPKIGVRRDDLKPGLRVFSHRGYGIFYEIDDDRQLVNVVRVIAPRLNVTPKTFE